jgi:hypothetical protein
MPDESTGHQPEFLSPAEFALFSGLSLSTVSRRLAAGDIPKIQPGGPRCRVLIPRWALDSVMALAIQDQGAAKREGDRGDRQKALGIPRLSGPQPRWKQTKAHRK